MACWFAIQGCYKDKGNYSYLPVNKVSITLDPPSREAYIGEVYTYTPTLAFSDPDTAGRFRFWWENMGNMGLIDHHVVICEGLELRYEAKDIGQEGVQFCVEEIKTGTITTASMTLSGSSRYGKGWLVLSDNAGASTLTYIRPGYEDIAGVRTRVYTDFPDLYSTLHPDDPLGRGPIAVRQVMSQRGIYSIVYVVQEDETVCLNGQFYRKEVKIKDEFVGDAPAGLKPVDFFEDSYTSMILNEDGKIYFREPYYGDNTDFFTYSFANFPMSYQGKELKIERLIPSLAISSYFSGMYDKENKKILWMKSFYGESGLLLTPSYTTPPATYLDFSNLGDDMELLYCGTYGEYNLSANIVTVYVKGGESYIQQGKGTVTYFDDGLIILSEIKHFLFPDNSHITSNTKFYQLKTRPYLFFAEGNQVYWYDLTTTDMVRLFYTFPAGEKVVDMSSNPQESELGVILESGKFITLDVRNEMLMTGVKIYETTIPGKAVDLEYRFTEYSQYSNRTSTNAAD